MRKLLFLLVCAFVTSAIQAQRADMYSIIYHENPGYAYTVYNSIQQRDGDFIVDTYLFEDLGNYEYIPLGYMIFKVSANTYAIIDSLFMADTIPNPT